MIPSPKLEPRTDEFDHVPKFGRNARIRQPFGGLSYEELVQNHDIRPKNSSKIAILDAK